MDGQGPRKIEVTIEKRTPGAAEPHTIERTATYFELDGTEVTDPTRQAEIERELAQRGDEE